MEYQLIKAETMKSIYSVVFLFSIMCVVKTGRTQESSEDVSRSGDEKSDTNAEFDLTFPGCGIRPKESAGPKRNFMGRIVGGESSEFNSWPWMVVLSTMTEDIFICGGSLISTKYVLTAAHCCDSGNGTLDPERFEVLVDSVTWRDGTQYPVEQVLIHPSYKKDTFFYDICLLRLGKKVTLTETVNPVCLLSDKKIQQLIVSGNEKATVTGWGYTEGGTMSNVLKEITIPILPTEACNGIFEEIGMSNMTLELADVVLCAGPEKGGKDACEGDDGGPVVQQLKDSSYVQVGIVSDVNGCARKHYPGVYTRVSHYSKWLYDNTDLGKKM